MVDPNCRPSITRDAVAYRARMTRLLARADIVKLSTEDLAYLVPDESVAAATAWVQALGPRAVLLTDGPAPVRVLVDGAEHLVPAPAVEVVDTIGAGDTFGGAFLACLVQGGGTRSSAGDVEAVLRSARFAVRASAAVCGRAGANPPTLAELGGWPAA
jgi:fructokinase